ncbi:hypothetical protein H0262_05545 [Psychrobacter cryohalolentis]|uniref:hypothetical protein n=1 Tax=Psychrobacter sp. D2 TaxID=2759702 RepID=UPI0015E5B3AB|nr:hypothetical protein [Psychrobacter sp. D2]MBA2057345.1 hypothetical protein [Psychrobacter sp. D2]
MTAYQAQSKLNEVYDFLRSFEGMINPDNIRLGRWLRDAQALRKSSPAEGFLMEALVYRVQGKLDQAIEYAEKSYRLDKALACNNYTTILSDAGHFKEAVELALITLQKDNLNTYALNRLIIDASITIDKDSLSQGLALFKDPNGKFKDLLNLAHRRLKKCDETISTLEKAGITIDSYAAVSSIASRALNSYYLGNSRFEMAIQHNEAGVFLIINEEIPNIDINDCFIIHDKYINDLIDSDLSFKDYKRIVYSFLPLENNDLLEGSVCQQQETLM